ncbi:hypothetical protein [Halosimplex carlsbadense]|nr:hypothetical protein [Halosimplex carlsbadense]
MSGTVTETYAAALRHDIADLADRVAAGETLALACFEGDSKRS